MIDNFGHTTYVDLKEGGSEIPVTNENRQEYVDLYVSHYLDRSIAKQFEFVFILILFSKEGRETD